MRLSQPIHRETVSTYSEYTEKSQQIVAFQNVRPILEVVSCIQFSIWENRTDSLWWGDVANNG